MTNFSHAARRVFSMALMAMAFASLAACASQPDLPPPPPPPPVVEQKPVYPSESLAGVRPRPDIRPSYMGGVKPVRVALLLPLKQNNERNGLAQSMLNAAELALFEFGAQNVLLMPKDTKGTEDGARAAVTQALREGADLILGPLFAEEVRAAGALARGNGVSLIGFSTDRTVAGGGVYLLSFLPEGDVKRVTSFAAQRGARSFAGLIPRTTYGDRVLSSLGESLSEMGFAPTQLSSSVTVYGPAQVGQNGLVALERYGTDAASLSEPVARLSGQSFDALLLPEGGSLLKDAANVMAANGMSGRSRLLGTSLWDDPALGSQSVLVGGWFAAPSPNKRSNFVERYKSVYGSAPARLASLAYDAVSLAISLSRGADANADSLRSTTFSSQSLLDPNGFDGVDGIFRFHADGTSERGLAVMEVRPGGAIIVDQPPGKFDLR